MYYFVRGIGEGEFVEKSSIFSKLTRTDEHPCANIPQTKNNNVEDNIYMKIKNTIENDIKYHRIIKEKDLLIKIILCISLVYYLQHYFLRQNLKNLTKNVYNKKTHTHTTCMNINCLYCVFGKYCCCSN